MIMSKEYYGQKDGKQARSQYGGCSGCHCCNTIHRELPDFVLPYKQYEAEVIHGVIEGIITPETAGYAKTILVKDYAKGGRKVWISNA